MAGMDCCRGARLAGAASLADQTWAVLLQLAFERVAVHFAAAVAELDLAPTQARALHELDVEPPISMRELAQRLKSDPSNVTGLVDTLERAGHAVRVPDPRDRRSVLVRITDDGRTWLDEFRRPSQLAMAALFRGFTATETTRLRHLCLRLVENQQHLARHLEDR